MGVRTIRLYGDPVLNTRAEEVVDDGARLERLVTDLFDTLHSTGGIGLAANQIGVLSRVFVYDLSHRTGSLTGHIINPTVTPLSDDLDHDTEGCLSIPGVRAAVPRHHSVLLTGRDLRGRRVAVHATGLLAHCFQHETDHLDGILFPRRLTEDDRREIMAQIRQTSGAPQSVP